MTDAAGKWDEVELAGHPMDVYLPPKRHDHGYVVIYLHGVHLNRLHDKAAFLQQFDRHGLAAVCPRAGRCWWLDRICPDFDPAMTPQQYVRHDVLGWIRQRLGVEPPRIALLGTSMGGQGALRLAYQFPDTFPVCAAISPAIDFHRRLDEGDEILGAMFEDREAARQETAILHIHPLNWPRHQFFCCDPTDVRWYEGVDRLHMKLNSLGVPHECDLETTGGGHGFEYYSLMATKAIEFLVRGLDRERLRLV